MVERAREPLVRIEAVGVCHSDLLAVGLIRSAQNTALDDLRIAVLLVVAIGKYGSLLAPCDHSLGYGRARMKINDAFESLASGAAVPQVLLPRHS